MLQNKQVRLVRCLLVCEYAIKECKFIPFYTTCEFVYYCKPQRGSDSSARPFSTSILILKIALSPCCCKWFSDLSISQMAKQRRLDILWELSLSMGVWERVGRLQKEERDFVRPCVGRKRKIQTEMRCRKQGNMEAKHSHSPYSEQCCLKRSQGLYNPAHLLSTHLITSGD